MLLKQLFFIAVSFVSINAISQSQTKAKINHTAVYVVNLQASKHFYEHIIGLDTIAEPFKDGKHAWFKTGANIAMHIIEGAEAKKEYYKNQHTCFSVASIQLFTQVLKKYNMVWEDRDGAKNAITTRVDGVHQLWLQDPDGYWIEINDDQQ